MGENKYTAKYVLRADVEKGKDVINRDGPSMDNTEIEGNVRLNEGKFKAAQQLRRDKVKEEKAKEKVEEREVENNVEPNVKEEDEPIV